MHLLILQLLYFPIHYSVLYDHDLPALLFFLCLHFCQSVYLSACLIISPSLSLSPFLSLTFTHSLPFLKSKIYPSFPFQFLSLLSIPAVLLIGVSLFYSIPLYPFIPFSLSLLFYSFVSLCFTPYHFWQSNQHIPYSRTSSHLNWVCQLTGSELKRKQTPVPGQCDHPPQALFILSPQPGLLVIKHIDNSWDRRLRYFIVDAKTVFKLRGHFLNVPFVCLFVPVSVFTSFSLSLSLSLSLSPSLSISRPFLCLSIQCRFR